MSGRRWRSNLFSVSVAKMIVSRHYFKIKKLYERGRWQDISPIFPRFQRTAVPTAAHTGESNRFLRMFFLESQSSLVKKGYNDQNSVEQAFRTKKFPSTCKCLSFKTWFIGSSSFSTVCNKTNCEWIILSLQRSGTDAAAMQKTLWEITNEKRSEKPLRECRQYASKKYVCWT